MGALTLTVGILLVLVAIIVQFYFWLFVQSPLKFGIVAPRQLVLVLVGVTCLVCGIPLIVWGLEH